MIAREELQRLRALTDAATPGPWSVQEWRHWAEPSKPNFTLQYTANDRYNAGAKFALAVIEKHGSGDGSSGANAAFIAAAREAVPALLAERDELRALLVRACDDLETEGLDETAYEIRKAAGL